MGEGVTREPGETQRYRDLFHARNHCISAQWAIRENDKARLVRETGAAQTLLEATLGSPSLFKAASRGDRAWAIRTLSKAHDVIDAVAL